MIDYTTTAGTEPDQDEQHEPRTIRHTNSDGDVYMMSEIADGTFVAWSHCKSCLKTVLQCTCASGPVEPPYIERWRTQRFADSFKGRGVEPALPTILKVRDRRIAAVMRFLLARGYVILPPGSTDSVMTASQEAQDAAYGDSNDEEIELLRDALELALSVLNKNLPESHDPDDVADRLDPTSKEDTNA